jgi:hypothetical protein
MPSSRRLRNGAEWAYEIKWDGYRALGSSEWLFSHRNKPLHFLSIRIALHELPSGTNQSCSFRLDG